MSLLQIGMEDLPSTIKQILVTLKFFMIPLPGKGLSKKEKSNTSLSMDFRFKVDFLTVFFKEDEDSSIGIGILSITHMGTSASLFRLCWSTYGYLILNVFFVTLKFRITML